MRIVDRKAFLELPENTVFSKYEPCLLSDIAIKGETLESNDFFVQQISDAIDCEDSRDFINSLELSRETGISIKMDFNCQGRDGLFDDGQLFAVWEEPDIHQLIDRLRKCLKE